MIYIPNVPEIADRNAKLLIGNNAEIQTLLGDLCQPLLERRIKVDLIYANIPNIPSDEPVWDKKVSASRFMLRNIENCPKIFQTWCLTLQYLFLRQARDAVNRDGVVVDAIGARVPYGILEQLYVDNGYRVRELTSVYKIQSEPEDVLPGYVQAEKEGGIEFDFYDHSVVWPLWEKELRYKRLFTPTLKEVIQPYRMSASEALDAFKREDDCRAYLQYSWRNSMNDIRTLAKAIGDTPLVRIPFECNGRIFAKLEYLNPGGSIKDRSALFMIEEAEKKGELKSDGTIIEASSGNQGISVAMLGAAKRYKVIIIVSEKISPKKLQTIQAYGARVVVCPATDFIEDPKGYYCQALALQKQTPNSIFLNQYFSLTNPMAHYETLGPEIWEQTNGTITHFFAAAGTSGTISGAGKFLKEKNKDIKVIAVDVATSFRQTGGKPTAYKMEGIGVDFDTPCLDEAVIDEFIPITDEEGLGMLPELASRCGFLVGPSSGAVAYAVRSYAKKLGKNEVAVVIFADSGRAYLSKGYYASTYSLL